MSETGTGVVPAAGESEPVRSEARGSPGSAVVGIGASAGGLEAFRSLFGALPDNTGLAFIVIQHLSPEHPSILAKTLARFTSMPVVEIEDGMSISPDRVHVLPSNAEVLVGGGVLRLTPRPALPGGRAPIDGLFRSLASEFHSRAIGVVLSGTGEDGTGGLKEIKAEGGITFAQTPESAQFSGMPASASAAGVVDRVLPPDRIAAELVRLSRHPYVVGRPTRGLEPSLRERDDTVRVLSLVRRQSGADFSVYRSTTVGRRIARRMALHRIGSVAEYADLVEGTPAEAKALAEDLLIHVTRFFRDPEVFDAIKRVVLSPLLAQKPAGPIRVWVPGCSSGEEVYSLAMCFLEHLDASPEVDFQIFGSDLSQRAIERARAGVYPESAVRELGADRGLRFFTRAGEERRIAKSVRDRCVFVIHDLARDPPFAKLDLISCRNVLIYFSDELHRRLFSMFHYCLNRPGFLLLGRSENVTSNADLFEPADLEHRIFSRIGEGRHFSFPSPVASRAAPAPVASTGQGLPRAAVEAQRQADHLLLSRFAPPGVVVNDRLEVIQFRGRTGDDLEQPPGRPQTNLLKMVHGKLLSELRRAIAAARERGVAVRVNAEVSRKGRKQTVAVEVVPLLAGRESGDPYFLVLFLGDAQAPAIPRTHDADSGEAVREARVLQEELAATKLYLESMLEQHQSSEDESASVNEELTAANEELQSTNEELESAKEELQSANEELTTLNDELGTRNAELDLVANDLSNVLGAASLPIVIVDGERRIRRFTPDARRLFAFIPSDLGRPLDDVKRTFGALDLDEQIAEVMRGTEARETEVQDSSGRWFRMQIRPYRAGERGLVGAVLAFVDVDVLKKTAREAEVARDYAQAIVESVPTPLLVVDDGCRLVSANPAFERVLGGGEPVRAGDGLFASLRGVVDATDLRRAVEQALGGGAAPARLEINANLPGAGNRTYAVTVRTARPGGTPCALLAFEDLTEQPRIEEERAAREAAEGSNRTKDLFLATLSHELRTPLSTILMQAQVLQGRSRSDPLVERAGAAIHRAAVLQKRLIDDLLDVSRIVSGKLALDQQVVDLGAVVEAAVEEARAFAEAKGIALTSTVAPGMTAVYADPARMQQVVSNLLTNAKKFTGRGGSVTVTLNRQEGEARVTVRDTGAGIRPEFLAHLFDRFSQADSSTTRFYGGLGLGLAIVKHIVELHGGRVGADSPGEGQGATFWVTLPLVRAPAVERAVQQPEPRGAGIAGARVLVVDDDESTRECLTEILNGAGATVRAAASAVEGLEALEEFKPDILLSDLAMPARDGLSLITAVRSLPPERGGRTPAAALSALAGVDDRQRALDAGFQMHVTKPADLDVLLVAVGQLLEIAREQG